MADPLPGPFGKSWFTLEFYTHEGPWFLLELDTTAPAVTFDQPWYYAEAGEALSVVVTLDEPDVRSASMVLPGSGRVALTLERREGLQVVATGLTPTTVPVRGLLDEAGNLQGYVEVVAEDAVGNVQTYTVPLTVIGVGVAPQPQPVAPNVGYGELIFTHIAGPLVGDPFEQELPGEVVGVRRVQFAVNGEVIGVGLRRTVLEMSGQVAGARAVQLSLDGVRLEGPRMSRLAQEDELLLLMI